MSREQGARFSPQPTRNKSCCSVNGCNSKACRDLTVRFHSFPKSGGADFVKLPNRLGVLEKMSRRDAWARRLMINKTITENTRVCSLHFRRSDYILPDAPTEKRYLKRDAVPSCNLPQSGNMPDSQIETRSQDYGYVITKSNRLEPDTQMETNWNRCWIKEEIKEEPTEPETRLELPNDDTAFQDYTDHQESSLLNVKTGPADSTIKFEPEEIDIKFESVDFPDLRNATTQTDAQPRGPKFSGITRTSRDLNVLTGIPNFGVLGRIVDVLKIASPRLAQARGLRLDAEDRIVMTLMKLKQDLTYGALSVLFKCKSPKSCKRIILRTLETLSRCLKLAIRWPGANETGAATTTLPDLPGDDLSNVRCIISRIEVAIKRPREVVKRVMTFSSCKRRHSAKFMTAVTSDGFICFLSRAYGGRTPHGTLFEESNVLNFLEVNDVLVAFKDFPIEDICRRRSVKLVKSLYSRNSEETRNPYRQRLNVNRRIRRFRIFRRRLPNTLATRTEQILTILCAVENLASLTSGAIVSCERS